jgi:DNA-binding response OmpR family regulator
MIHTGCLHYRLGQRGGHGVDYITKPFQQAEVLARIKTHVMLRKRERQLEQALAEIKTLSGILPICAYCKQIRNDQGYWQQVEDYISQHSKAMFSHGICPDCYRKEMDSFQAMMEKNKKSGQTPAVSGP